MDNRHTQGPLDQEFFQHAAFPLQGDESDDIHRYLASVRREAETLLSIDYVKEPNEPKKEQPKEPKESKESKEPKDQKDPNESNLKEKTVELDLRWRKDVVDTFLRLKNDTDAIEVTHAVEVPENATAWRNLVLKQEVPPIQYFYGLDHLTVIKLVIYYTKWISLSLSDNLSRWIWMTFLRLDAPLDVNEASIVRDLAKKAVKLNHHPRYPEAPQVAQQTIKSIIVLVADFYGQKDMVSSVARPD